MLNLAPVGVEQDIANVWLIGCLLGGSAFIAIGARAAGLALLGALAGAIIGFLAVSADIDKLAEGAMVGASVGVLVAGSLGLAWSPSSSARLLRMLGLATLLVGSVSLIIGLIASQRLCGSQGRQSCLRDAGGASLALFTVDAAWVGALCFIQAGRSKRTDTMEAVSDASSVDPLSL